MNQLVCAAAEENVQFFLNDSSQSGRAFCSSFQQLADACRKVSQPLERIQQAAGKYDFDSHTPGNGYRSFVAIFEKLYKKCLSACQLVQQQRRRMVFRLFKYTYLRDLKSWNDMLVALYPFLEDVIHLLDLEDNTDGGACLFRFNDQLTSQSQLIDRCRALESESFYGRHVAFQYCPSIENTLKFMVTLMASYSYYCSSRSARPWRFVKSLAMGVFYTMDHDYRASRVVHASRHATIDFCKSFWFLPESAFMKRVPDYMCPPMRVNQLIHVPPQPLQLTSLDGRLVRIPIPGRSEADGSPEPVQVRLMIAKKRQDKVATRKENGEKDQVSDTLIIHCHGGGFVSQTSQAHEMYLRFWAADLDVPILSIDYSLAPEHAYPRQLREILFVFAWVQRNPSAVGTTAKKIIFVGDSAGGNLLLGVTLLASRLNLRLPDGLFLAYAPLLVDFVASPSRFFCLMDPLLPLGFTLKCLNAYAGDVRSTSQFSEIDSNDPLYESCRSDITNSSTRLEPEVSIQIDTNGQQDELDFLCTGSNHPFMSPYLTPDEDLIKLPPISLLSLQLDPFLDDSIEFAKRCRRAGCDVELNILPDIPHGFLSFSLLSPEAKQGMELCVEKIRGLMEKNRTDRLATTDETFQ